MHGGSLRGTEERVRQAGGNAEVAGGEGWGVGRFWSFRIRGRVRFGYGFCSDAGLAAPLGAGVLHERRVEHFGEMMMMVIEAVLSILDVWKVIVGYVVSWGCVGGE
jgi:hypothetical protein